MIARLAASLLVAGLAACSADEQRRADTTVPLNPPGSVMPADSAAVPAVAPQRQPGERTMRPAPGSDTSFAADSARRDSVIRFDFNDPRRRVPTVRDTQARPS